MAADDTEMAELMRALANDPRTRRDVVKAIKVHRPEMRFPDVDAEDVAAEMRAEMDRRRQEDAAEKAKERLEAQRRKVAEKFGEEAVAEIEQKVMPKLGTYDYDAAAEYYAATQKPAEEKRDVPHRPASRWTMPDYTQFTKNPGAARDIAYETIDQIRLGR